MEADSPPLHSTVESHAETVSATEEDSLNRRLNNSWEETEADDTIHGFNILTNVTVIEKQPETTIVCEGSDSGVEVIETNDPLYQRALSSNSGNSQDFETLTSARSCDSSIISYCSNYEDAYNLLVRRNSTLIEDYTLRNGDGTSENGSESSSITGSSSSRNSKRINLANSKKRVNVQETKKSATTKERSRSKPPITPRRTEGQARLKSIDRIQGKSVKKSTPNTLDLGKKEPKRPSSARSTKTPSVTPTDDGRWPSINSKPAPLMSRSLRGILDTPKTRQMDTKTIEKYATLPRRRKEKSNEDVKEVVQKKLSRDDVNRLTNTKKTLSRETTPSKTLNVIKKKQKIKIYHETGVQTALTITDVNKALAGLSVTLVSPHDVEKCDKNEQVDMSVKDIEILNAQIKDIKEKYEALYKEHKLQSDRLTETEGKLREETVEKEGLKEELKTNSQRVLAILGEGNLNDDENVSSDSLMVLESPRMGALEAKSRELLVHQGSSVSGTAVALSALIGRLEGLVDELVTSYSISDQELEDVIFHNEAYSNSSSSPDATPEKCRKFLSDKTPSPKKGSSFVSAVINAIKNAAAQSPFAGNKDISKDNLCTDNSSPNEMLDSETEPCLMMEHVLEDVVIPDGHTHNMISSCHSMLSSQSESFIDMSRSSFSTDMPSLCDIFPSLSLVDQVIDVDNLVTRLLKVIRIIQLENDDCMNELQEQRDRLSEQVDKQKENNKLVGKQLKDWEVLGARLKTEVKELMYQLSKKNNEIDGIKTELNKQREEVEKLNQDVCELSTALAKAELEMKMKDEEVTEAIKNWEKNNEMPTPEVLARLNAAQNEVPLLKEKLSQKERHLSELTQEFLASRQVLSESLKEAVNEAKKQYEAIDNALEVLHNNQNVVQQCTPLAELQRELENTSFQSASAMPLAAPADCNANAALLQAIANLQINTTA
ncbi:WEB family protein [Asbolus verrucosus]|uniref:WEB family protein n=1 Tax=Asbolus verrucosus TaxID=1661398 RepID=A0A482VQZ4_ASBVE|nr:WEB family protein [Asbolus verrucosus]